MTTRKAEQKCIYSVHTNRTPSLTMPANLMNAQREGGNWVSDKIGFMTSELG